MFYWIRTLVITGSSTQPVLTGDPMGATALGPAVCEKCENRSLSRNATTENKYKSTNP